MRLVDAVTTGLELAAALAAAVALVWAAALAPAPWSGPAVAAAVAVSLIGMSGVLILLSGPGSAGPRPGQEHRGGGSGP
jgi:hypothetical protein